MMKRWYSIKILKCIMIISVCIIFIMLLYLSFKRVNDDTLQRNITISTLWVAREPKSRDVAWDSELPNFIKNDIKLAEKNKYDIEYTYRDTIINIIVDGKTNILSIKSIYNKKIELEKLVNYSFYKNNNELIIYGFNKENKSFEKIIIGNKKCEKEIQTFDSNIPFFLVDESQTSLRIENYSLINKEEYFIIYKDGREISKENFPKGENAEIFFEEGFVRTSNNNLYTVYIQLKNQKPDLTFVHIGNVDNTNINYKELRSNNGKYVLPVCLKNGQYCAAVPNDWEVYKNLNVNYSKLQKQIENPVYGMEWIKLKEAFDSIEIVLNDNMYNVKFIYNFNGEKMYINYIFDKYINIDYTSKEFEIMCKKTGYTKEQLKTYIESLKSAYID